MPSAHNRQLGCCAAVPCDQRVGGGEAGNGDPAGAGAVAAVLGGFGFFGRIGFRAGFGGGPAG